MANPWRERLHRRRHSGGRRFRKRDCADCADCGDCGDCSPFMLAPLLVLLRIVPGAFRATAVDPHTTRPGGVGGRIAARLIRSYQLNYSAARPARCTMTPSCSRYGLQAVSRHGLVRGGAMIVGRLRRCGGDGERLDPVQP